MINIAKLLGFGGVNKVISGVTNLVQGFTGSQKERDTQSHKEHTGLMSAYANELLPRDNRTWWDSLIDGINRLVRPIFSFGVLYIFYFCIDDPAGFSVTMQALVLMPVHGWALLGTIIVFWFGGRFINKELIGKRIKPLDPKAVAEVIDAKARHDEQKAAREERLAAVREKLKIDNGPQG